MSLAGRQLVIIGGSSGIGFATARLALERGARVHIASSSPSRVAAACARLPGPVGSGTVDVRSEASLAGFFATLPEIDHLLVCAHAGATAASIRPLADLDLAAVLAGFDVKVMGALRSIRAALPRLAARASIALVSGAASRRVLPGHSALATFNAAIEAMTRQLAFELAPRRVVAICPGLTRTEAYDGLPTAAREAMFARAAGLPVGRVGEAADIAEAILMALDNGYLTGTTLDVDGGGNLLGAPG